MSTKPDACWQLDGPKLRAAIRRVSDIMLSVEKIHVAMQGDNALVHATTNDGWSLVICAVPATWDPTSIADQEVFGLNFPSIKATLTPAAAARIATGQDAAVTIRAFVSTNTLTVGGQRASWGSFIAQPYQVLGCILYSEVRDSALLLADCRRHLVPGYNFVTIGNPPLRAGPTTSNSPFRVGLTGKTTCNFLAQCGPQVELRVVSRHREYRRAEAILLIIDRSNGAFLRC